MCVCVYVFAAASLLLLLVSHLSLLLFRLSLLIKTVESSSAFGSATSTTRQCVIYLSSAVSDLKVPHPLRSNRPLCSPLKPSSRSCPHRTLRPSHLCARGPQFRFPNYYCRLRSLVRRRPVRLPISRPLSSPSETGNNNKDQNGIFLFFIFFSVHIFSELRGILFYFDFNL